MFGVYRMSTHCKSTQGVEGNIVALLCSSTLTGIADDCCLAAYNMRKIRSVQTKNSRMLQLIIKVSFSYVLLLNTWPASLPCDAIFQVRSTIGDLLLVPPRLSIRTPFS